MNTFVMALSLAVALLVLAVASVKGLDLRKGSSWLYSAISFLCGFAGGLSLNANLVESLKGGALFAFLTLFTGGAMRRHKQRYEGMGGPLLLKYGKEDDPSLFAKLVRRLLGKYK
jgi:hypothetical protein